MRFVLTDDPSDPGVSFVLNPLMDAEVDAVRWGGSGLFVSPDGTALITTGSPIDPSYHEPLRDWMVRHGVSRRKIPPQNMFKRDVERRQIRYLDYVRGGEYDTPLFEDQGIHITTIVTVQLESPPAPFPPVPEGPIESPWGPAPRQKEEGPS